MTSKKLGITAVLLTLGINVYAGQVDGSAVLGSMLGAGAGSAVGSAVGGKEGAIIGGGAGGAIGAAIGSSKESSQGSTRVVTHEKVIYVDDDHRDNGKHKGHYKNKRKHGHDRD
ncbi:MAG TPA: glycine zipper domain-containing protein [Sulfuricurvum sp.]|nr:glycine zipper domain-containing protein [Sulfuricurvum sp.]